MFSADFTSGSRGFTQGANFDSSDACVLISYGVCRMRARVQLKTLFRYSALETCSFTVKNRIKEHVF